MNRNYKNMLVVFAGFFFLSLFSNTISPFITTIKSSYGVSDETIAILPSVVYSASFAISIAASKYMHNLGLKRGLYISFSFGVLASIIIIISTSFGILLFGYFISGLAVGMGSLFLNTTLSLLPKEYQKFSMANACFGLGGILIQPIDRLILRNGINFKFTYLIHIGFMIIFIFLATRLRGITITKKKYENKNSGSILKNALILLLSIAIFFYVGAEISTTNWTGTFLEKYYKMNKTEVPNLLMGFWILFTLGRVFGDKVLNKIGQLRYLAIAPLLSIAGIFVILSGTYKVQALIAIIIIGLTISLIYPALQGFMVQYVKKEDVPSASAIITIFNNLGATFLTYVIGLAAGFRVTNVYIIQIIFYLYIAIIAIYYLTHQKKKA